MSNNKIIVRQECPCGKFLLIEEEEAHHMTCLAYLVNGRGRQINISCEYTPVRPLSGVEIKFDFPIDE